MHGGMSDSEASGPQGRSASVFRWDEDFWRASVVLSRQKVGSPYLPLTSVRGFGFRT